MNLEGRKPAGVGPGNISCEERLREVAIFILGKAIPRWDGELPLSQGGRIGFHLRGSRADLRTKGQTYREIYFG